MTKDFEELSAEPALEALARLSRGTALLERATAPTPAPSSRPRWTWAVATTSTT